MRRPARRCRLEPTTTDPSRPTVGTAPPDLFARPTATAASVRSRAAPTLRPATEADLAACTHVWRTAIEDYTGRLGQPAFPFDLERLRRLLAHVRATDPERFWVATAAGASGAGDDPTVVGGERIVGYGSATVRGRSWFLGQLFVTPAEQGRGIGRSLLDRTLDGLPRPDQADRSGGVESWSFATATDSVQPISNALYAGLGIVPRVPVLELTGTVERAGELPRLPAGTRAVAFADLGHGIGAGTAGELGRAVAALDRAVLGFEHPQDHGYLEREHRLGFLYRGVNGAPLGYGYTSPVGRVGPVAALEADLLAPIVGHLLTTVRPNGASTAWVPGSAGAVVSAMLRAGLRLEGFPALLCWSRPAVDVTRYLPITLALL